MGIRWNRSYSAHLTAERAVDPCALPHDQLCGAAADVDHAAVFPVRGPLKGQGRFLFAGADMQRQPCFVQQLLGERRLIGRVPRGTGGKQVDLLRALGLGGFRHALHRRRRRIHACDAQITLRVQSRKEPRSLAVPQELPPLLSIDFRQKHTH